MAAVWFCCDNVCHEKVDFIQYHEVIFEQHFIQGGNDGIRLEKFGNDLRISMAYVYQDPDGLEFYKS